MFGKHTFKFSWMPFAAKALWTRFVQCSFNCIHFHCYKIARWNMDQIQSTLERCQQQDTTSVVQRVAGIAGGPGVPRSIPLLELRKYPKTCCVFWKTIALAFWSWGNFRNELFFKKMQKYFSPSCSNQRPLHDLSLSQTSYRGSHWLVHIW